MDPLLRRAIAGDDAAWRALVDATAPWLHRFLDRRMGSRLRRAWSTSDLAQDVFARVFQAMRHAPVDATQRTFRRWVLRHADWVLASRGLAARRLEGESAVADGAVAAVAGPRATGPVTRRDQAEWLRALVGRLPERYAKVVEMRLSGRSYADIAACLGVAEATVRQRYSRVLRLLAELHGSGE